MVNSLSRSKWNACFASGFELACFCIFSTCISNRDFCTDVERVAIPAARENETMLYLFELRWSSSGTWGRLGPRRAASDKLLFRQGGLKALGQPAKWQQPDGRGHWFYRSTLLSSL